jgi:hypothetical protein
MATASSAMANSAATAIAAQAAAAGAAAVRDMENFSDHEINELLGLIPDEYTAEEQQQQVEEEAAAAAAAAIAAANAGFALGRGEHHSIGGTIKVVGEQSSSSNTNDSGPNVGLGSLRVSTEVTPSSTITISEPQQQVNQRTSTDDDEAQVRSERKRSREKQRRNDVNKQFSELTEVLKQIEREAQEMGRVDDSYGSLSTMMAIAASTGPTNRVDLIARTIVHLERLNRSAKKQKIEINNLREQLKNTKKSGEDMAEKLKDVMFNQQRQAISTLQPFAHYQHMTTNASAPTTTAPAPGGMQTTTNGTTNQQQQVRP